MPVSLSSNASPDHRHYFVDEAGDPVLFDKNGQLNVGKKGCSNFFLLGLISTENPDAIRQSLTALRADLLADSSFASIQSMKPVKCKTALLFHANTDHSRVRERVFKTLLSHDFRFSAVIRDKRALAASVLAANRNFGPTGRYTPSWLYDTLVDSLFKRRLHKPKTANIVFARSGKRDRVHALRQALERTQRKYYWRRPNAVNGNTQLVVEVEAPMREPCLQAADYCLWALQRLCETNDNHYWNMVWPKCSYIIDLSDTRKKGGAVYYALRDKKPLDQRAWLDREAWAVKNREGI